MIGTVGQNTCERNGSAGKAFVRVDIYNKITLNLQL